MTSFTMDSHNKTELIPAPKAELTLFPQHTEM